MSSWDYQRTIENKPGGSNSNHYMFILGTFFVLHDCWNVLKSWPSRRPVTRSSKSRNCLPIIRAKMKQKRYLYGRTPECHWSNCTTSVGLQIVFTWFSFFKKTSPLFVNWWCCMQLLFDYKMFSAFFRILLVLFLFRIFKVLAPKFSVQKFIRPALTKSI